MGHAADLRDASLMFDSVDLEVVQTNDDFLLRSSQFNALSEATEVLARAVDLLRLVNGIAKTRSKAFEGLRIDCVVKDNPDGSQHICIPLAVEARVIPEDEGVLSDGTPITADLPANVGKLVAATSQTDVVSRVLTIYGAIGDSWQGLYMVLDAIQEDAGGERGLLNSKWLPTGDVKLLKQTANNYGAVGIDARHGFYGEPMRKKPMRIEDARQMIRAIVSAWLTSKGL